MPGGCISSSSRSNVAQRQRKIWDWDVWDWGCDGCHIETTSICLPGACNGCSMGACVCVFVCVRINRLDGFDGSDGWSRSYSPTPLTHRPQLPQLVYTRPTCQQTKTKTTEKERERESVCRGDRGGEDGEVDIDGRWSFNDALCLNSAQCPLTKKKIVGKSENQLMAGWSSIRPPSRLLPLQMSPFLSLLPPCLLPSALSSSTGCVHVVVWLYLECPLHLSPPSHPSVCFGANIPFPNGHSIINCMKAHSTFALVSCPLFV